MGIAKWVFTGLIACGICAAAIAQTYPAKPITVITSLAAGGPYTVVMRGLADSLGQALGRPVLLDSRTGGEGVIGMQACARAAADGYTLCYPNSTIFTVNPLLYKNLPYDTRRDFVPIVQVGFVNSLLVVNPSVPARGFAELIALAKAKPESLAYGTFAFGNLLVAWIRHATGASFMSVPYKGAPQATTAVLSGEVQVTSNSIGTVLPLVKAGKLRAMVVTAKERSSIMPDVPSFKEFGMELDLRSWSGLFSPAGTPNEVLVRINREVNQLLADPRIQAAYLAPSAVEPAGGSLQDFATFLHGDREMASQLVKLAGMKPQ